MIDPWDLLAKQMRAEKLERMPFVRPSAMPRFFECASSQADCEAPYNPNSDAAAAGTAAHKAIELHINGIDPDPDQIAADHGTDPEELRDAYGNAVAIWDTVAPYFGDSPKTEVKVDGGFTKGTVDLLRDDDRRAILDWKFGLIRNDYRAQVLSYAYCVGIPESGEIDAWVAWPRLDGEPDRYRITQDDLDWFESQFLKQVNQIGRQYSPGHACQYCERKFECKARAHYISSAIAMVTGANPDEVTPEALGALYPLTLEIDHALDHYRKVLRMAIQDVGPIDTGTGKTLHLSEVSRVTLDPGPASAVLASEFDFTSEQLFEVMQISKTKVVKAIRDRVPRTEKKAAEKKLMDALEKGGSVRRFVYEKIQPRKTRAK